ncbi:MAG TPA: GTPase Era [Bellilinea sp.]|nr:GTPase Era [Bellilinea sp.]
MTDNTAFKAGYAALIGRPNVGKSTLMNRLVGQKIAAVSPRPQTTRNRQLGILTTDEAQIIFMDTPGIHEPVHKLGEYMNKVAEATLRDADILVWMVDGSTLPNPEDERAAARITALKRQPPTFLLLNKADTADGGDREAIERSYQMLVPNAKALWISAVSGINCDKLVSELIQALPEGDAIYDEDSVTDAYERDIAVELIRESALKYLRDEIPHSMAIRIDEFTEREDGSAYIHATLMVEKENHKGIVIGKGGQMLKTIGTAARQEIEDMSGRKVFLELRVKVNEDWRNKSDALAWLGYKQKK